MIEKIICLLPDYCKENGNITEETSFSSDLGMSSLDFFAFIGDLEKEFNVEISDKDTLNLFTVGDVIRCIEEKTK